MECPTAQVSTWLFLVIQASAQTLPPLEALLEPPIKPTCPYIRLFIIFAQLQLSVTISRMDVCLSQPPRLAHRCSEPTAE